MPQADTQQARGDQQHTSKSDSECGSESAVEAGLDAGASDQGERSKGEAKQVLGFLGSAQHGDPQEGGGVQPDTRKGGATGGDDIQRQWMPGTTCLTEQ